MSKPSFIRTDRPDERILLITLDRPEKHNALSKAVLGELAAALRDAGRNDAVHCVVLTGAGRAFAAGADIADMMDRGLDSYLDPGRLEAWDAIDHFPKPIVAAVNGYALGGGCELVMLCDIVVASDKARFGQPEIKVGVLPGDGGTQRLPRIVGQPRAMKAILTGEMMDATEARQIGLVSDVVPAEALLDKTLEIAGLIASRPPLSVQAAKRAVRAAREKPLREGLLFERGLVKAIFETEDREEGMRAFLEKRKPAYKGR